VHVRGASAQLAQAVAHLRRAGVVVQEQEIAHV
jgi:hypothetical protein